MPNAQEAQTKQTRRAFVPEEEVQSRISAREALITANRFLLETMRDRFTAGLPKQVTFSTRSVWIVPILPAHHSAKPRLSGRSPLDDQIPQVFGRSRPMPYND